MKLSTVRFSFTSTLTAVVLFVISSANAQQSGDVNALTQRANSTFNLTDSTTEPAPQKTNRLLNAVPFSKISDSSPEIEADARRNSRQPDMHLGSPFQKPKPQFAAFGESNPQRTNSNEFRAETQAAGRIAKYVDLNNCTVSFIDDIKLPAKESGVIESLLVKEGEFIPAGKVVGKIDDELYLRMMEQAEMRFNMAKELATDSTAIQAAEKKYRVAGIEAAKTKRLGQTGSKSDSEVMMAIYTKDIALLELEKAKREKDKAYAEARLEAARLAEVQTRIKRHVLQSSFDAYVVEIFKKPQEFVQSGEEVMRIARMDKLWVQGIVNISDLNPNEVVDRPVTVTVDLARGETTTFEGKIVYVALERQSLKSYMVKAEIQNRPSGGHWVLQPLSSVRMRIHLDGKTPQNSIGNAGSPSVKR